MHHTTDRPEELTLHEVADELGVHYMTAYRYVRLGMLEATKRGRSWVVTREDLGRFLEAPTEPSERGTAPWDERLLNRMLAPDDAGAWRVIEAALSSGVSAPDIYMDVITPALREVGTKWANGEIDVAQEHAASQIARRVVARLSPQMSRRGVRRGTVVVGSTATEMHDLPVSIVADLLRSRHFDVVDLGGNLPPESFASAVRSANNLVAAAIGVTALGQEDEIGRTVAAIRAASDVPILIGGAGVTNEVARSLGADAVATTGADAIEAIEHLTTRT
ncbi:MAG TPA: B12-binding domain-containing protein [Acidimicrobiia bacterium]|nr:B12-binding domain-containing protein [Acidimicrobiia bacterium]